VPKNAVNPTNYDMIPAFVPDEKGVAFAVIETPAQTRHKYAFEPKYGIMTLKMTLAEGLAWPYDYGFVPQTLGDDGDPVDVLVLNDAPTFSGCLLQVRMLGAVLLKKNGVENDRLVACPKRRPGVTLRTDAFESLGDIPKDMMSGIERFLVDYSAEEGNKISFEGTGSRKDAFTLIRKGQKRFRKRAK
jgi:inorganic pyrophosphatase